MLRSLAHWVSENEKLLARQENLLVLDDDTFGESWDGDIDIQLIMAPCFVSVVAL